MHCCAPSPSTLPIWFHSPPSLIPISFDNRLIYSKFKPRLPSFLQAVAACTSVISWATHWHFTYVVLRAPLLFHFLVHRINASVDTLPAGWGILAKEMTLMELRGGRNFFHVTVRSWGLWTALPGVKSSELFIVFLSPNPAPPFL